MEPYRKHMSNMCPAHTMQTLVSACMALEITNFCWQTDSAIYDSAITLTRDHRRNGEGQVQQREHPGLPNKIIPCNLKRCNNAKERVDGHRHSRQQQSHLDLITRKQLSDSKQRSSGQVSKPGTSAPAAQQSFIRHGSTKSCIVAVCHADSRHEGNPPPGCWK